MPLVTDKRSDLGTLEPAQRSHCDPEHRNRAVWIIAAGVAAAILGGAVLLMTHWPFTREAFTRSLEQDSQAQVAMTSFRETYFPYPGCIAEGVTIERDTSSPRLSVRRLTVVGSYIGLLHLYIPRVRAEGAVLEVSQNRLRELFADRTPGQHPTGTKIGEIDADGAEIHVQPAQANTPPLNFRFHKLRLDSVSSDSAVRFNALLVFPEPHGDVTLQGNIGPFRRGHAGETPLDGSYAVTNLKLEELTGIGGLLSSQGKFQGRLQAIDVKGTTDVPDFQLDVGVHPSHLKTDFHVLVNGTNGNVYLDPVQSTLGKTHIVAKGSINESSRDRLPNGVVLDLTSSSGRVEDLLLLFVHDDRSPMVGAISLRAHAVLPFADRSFLDKVKLQGDFGIAGASYTSPHTQEQVDVLSADARGQADKIEDDQERDKKNGTHTADEDMQRVVSDLKGHVVLQKGIATFTDLRFHVPGAGARMHGTYDLRSRAIDLQGVVHMETQVSHAATGPKSFLLKIIQPFTRHNHRVSPDGSHGSVLSVHVTGTYGHPSFAVQPMKGGS